MVDRLSIAALVIVYGYSILYSIVNLIVPIWGYFGILFYPKPQVQSLVLWIFAVLPVAWLPLQLRKPSECLTWGLYVLTYVPTILYSIGYPIEFYQTLEMSFTLLVGLSILNATSRLPYLKLPRIQLSYNQFWWGLGAVSLVFYGLVVWSSGIRFQLAGATEIYDVRADFVENLKFPANYAILWQSCVINPFWMAYGVCRRKPILFILGALGQIYFYAVAAFKALPASVVLVLIVAYATSHQGQRFGKRWTALVSMGVFVPAAITLYTGITPLIQLVVGTIHWRAIIQTSFLSNLYYDYFATHPQVNFADVKGLNLFMKSPYSEGYTYAVGSEFFGHLTSNATQANVNLWADGYANMGLTGVIIESLICAAVLWAIDSASRHVSPRFVAMAVSYQILTLTNGSIITGLFSQGLAIIVVLLYFMPSEPSLINEGRSSGLGVWGPLPDNLNQALQAQEFSDSDGQSVPQIEAKQHVEGFRLEETGVPQKEFGEQTLQDPPKPEGPESQPGSSGP